MPEAPLLPGAPIFNPLPPGFDVKKLAESPGSRFHLATRVDARSISEGTMDNFERVYREHVLDLGHPLIIENYHKTAEWPGHIFTAQWLINNHGGDHVKIRDLCRGNDIEFSLQHYLNNVDRLASRFTPQSYGANGEPKQRLYLKDMDHPPIWREKLQEILPSCTFYLNNTSDLMSSLPENRRALNMMCYIGHEGTFTPCHKEMCSSIGHNIMVSAPDGARSIWFFVRPNDREKLAAYFSRALSQDIELENYFASVSDWENAPVDVWIVEQKVGDFVIVPPASPHQVWNQGGITVKTAWNRSTPETLKISLTGDLYKCKLACREEAYMVKTILWTSICKVAKQLVKSGTNEDESMVRDFVTMYPLFDAMIVDEAFSPELPNPKVELCESDWSVTCSFCRGNIFNRFLSCKGCVIDMSGEEGEGDCYDVCMDCYTIGRRCKCGSELQWVEQYPWDTIKTKHARLTRLFNALVESNKFQHIFEYTKVARSPTKSLEISTSREGAKRSRAWVSQELIKKTSRQNSRALSEDTNDKGGNKGNCHVCKNPHNPVLYVPCGNNDCRKRYCYGVLWRAFNQDPYTIHSQFQWQCPFCLGQCICAACRNRAGGDQIAPPNNVVRLGYNTSIIADERSTETLVSFAQGNRKWVNDAGETSSRKRKRFGHESEDEDDFSQEEFSGSDTNGYQDEAGESSRNAAGRGDGSFVSKYQGKHPGTLEFPSTAVRVRGGDPSFISGKERTNVNLLTSQLSDIASKGDGVVRDGNGSGVGGLKGVEDGRGVGLGGEEGGGSGSFQLIHSNTVPSPRYSDSHSSALRSDDLSQLEMDPQAFRIAAGLLTLEDTPALGQAPTTPPEIPVPSLLSESAKLEVVRIVKTPTPEPVEAGAAWVQKAKLARMRVANLRGGKNRRKSLVVKLKVFVENWEDAPIQSDIQPTQMVAGGEEAPIKKDFAPAKQPERMSDDEGDKEEDEEASDENMLSDDNSLRAKRARRPNDGEYRSRNRSGVPPAPLMALSAVRSRRRSHSLQGNGGDAKSTTTPRIEKPDVDPEPPLTGLIPLGWSFAVIITEKPDRRKVSRLANKAPTSTGRRRGRPRKVQADGDFRIPAWSKIKRETGPAKASVRPRQASAFQETINLDEDEEESSEDDGYSRARGPPRPPSEVASEPEKEDGEKMIDAGYNEEDEYNRRWARRIF